MFMASVFLQMILIVLFPLVGVAFFTLFERKVLSFIHYRMGPNKVSSLGFLQPFADALKLLSKVESFPSFSLTGMYLLSPFFFFFLSLSFYSFYPMKVGGSSSSISFLFILLLFSVSSFSLILTGWFSNSKYSWIGSVRAFVQSLSFEVGLVLLLTTLMIKFGNLSLSLFLINQKDILLSFWWPLALSLFIILLAESSRAPFDLSEGESELVSGYSVEYGGLGYTLVFLGENLALLWAVVLSSAVFSWKLISVLTFLMVLVRSLTPRIRFDKMMEVFWINFLPLLLLVSAFFLVKV